MTSSASRTATAAADARGNADQRGLAEAAIALREWSLARLTTETPASDPAPPASPAAWRLFLHQERCAALLQDSLRRHPPAVALTADAARELAAAVQRDMRAVLSARAHFRTLSRIATELDCPLVLLKGSADVAEGMNIRVSDVDVWAPPDRIADVARSVDASGYTAVSVDEHWHLQPRVMPGAIDVEIHRAVTGFADPETFPLLHALPLPSLPGLHRMAPDDHLWTILCQAVLKHPERRTRTRDLLLVRRYLARCDAASEARVRRRMHEHPYRSIFERMMADATAPGTTDESTRRLYLHLARERPFRPGSLRAKVAMRARAIAISGPRAEWRRRRDVDAEARRTASVAWHAANAVAHLWATLLARH